MNKPSENEHIEGMVKRAVEDSIKPISERLDNYIIADEKWKKAAEPIIKMGTNISGFGVVAAYIFGMVAGAAGLMWLIIEIASKFINNRL